MPAVPHLPAPTEGVSMGAVSSPDVTPPQSPVPDLTPHLSPLPGLSESEPAMVGLGVLVILLVLLSLRVVMNYYKRQRRLSAHQAVTYHIRKGK